MAQYDKQVALAKRLIEKYGQKVIWNSHPEGTADSATPWKPDDILPIARKVTICFVSARDNEWRKLLAYLKGTEIPTGKLAGLMAAVAFTPSLKDTVTRGSVELRIASINLIAPSDQPILYTVEFQE